MLALAVVAASTFLAAVTSYNVRSIPSISPRGYVGGSAKVTVTGAFKVDADIPINKRASMSDREMTWLQFGVSGAAEPNMLLTVSGYEVGLGVARGKATATAGTEDCTGDMVVGERQDNGKYQCKGVTSCDPSTGQIGTVDIEIQFTALS
jgi:hypothetical protein